jgi:hypothetical protein
MEYIGSPTLFIRLAIGWIRLLTQRVCLEVLWDPSCWDSNERALFQVALQDAVDPEGCSWDSRSLKLSMRWLGGGKAS